jgi:hypothetical protein
MLAVIFTCDRDKIRHVVEAVDRDHWGLFLSFWTGTNGGPVFPPWTGTEVGPIFPL